MQETTGNINSATLYVNGVKIGPVQNVKLTLREPENRPAQWNAYAYRLHTVILNVDLYLMRALKRYARKLNWSRRYRKVAWHRLNKTQRLEAVENWLSTKVY